MIFIVNPAGGNHPGHWVFSDRHVDMGRVCIQLQKLDFIISLGTVEYVKYDLVDSHGVPIQVGLKVCRLWDAGGGVQVPPVAHNFLEPVA